MTNRELLMMLDGDLGERAVKNCIEIGLDTKYLDRKYSNGRKVSDALESAFIWAHSPEGFDFWNDIFDELQKIGL